jgi:acetyl-CoA carboxylase carboxyl transferase subunit beta
MRTDPRTSLSAPDWAGLVLDTGWKEVPDTLSSADPLDFPGYRDLINGTESVLAVSGTAAGFPLEVVSFDFSYFGGSLGVVAGERVARTFERAVERRAGVLVLMASGGARMQEGMVALVQMAKTIVARQGLAKAGLPLIAYLRHPTAGGAYASFGALADFVWAQPGATIGFAGRRVAEEMSGEPLPEGSHTAEFGLAKGLIDEIVDATHLRDRVIAVLDLVLGGDHPEPIASSAETPGPGGDAWDEVMRARDARRPTGRMCAESVTAGIVEIRGDRAGTSNTGLLAGIGRIAGRRFGILAHERTPLPPGAFRASQRLVRMAGRFGLPIATFVDTPGADPTSASEAGGIARAISGTFRDLLEHPRPTIAIITGEGGSGGALAFACCDRVYALEHSYFSVIAPEGAAAILRRPDVPQVARDLKVTAADLVAFGIADGVIAEPPGGAAHEIAAAVAAFAAACGDTDVRATRGIRWRRAGNRFLSGS